MKKKGLIEIATDRRGAGAISGKFTTDYTIIIPLVK
jgi:hypothetical protein